MAGVALRALWLEPASLRVNAYEVPVPGWPEADAGLRVALLSDLHVGSPWNGLERLRDVVARTNAAAPDLILLAGDYVSLGIPGGHYLPPESWEPILRGLRAPLGVYAVLGNHDFAFNPRRVTRSRASKRCAFSATDVSATSSTYAALSPSRWNTGT